LGQLEEKKKENRKETALNAISFIIFF